MPETQVAKTSRATHRLVVAGLAGSLVLAGATLAATPASADTTGTFGGMAWSSNGSTVTITGASGSPTSINIPAQIDIGAGSGLRDVTAVADNAFNASASLTSVTIGPNVQTIGATAFSENPHLTSVTIGSSVTSIGYRAFNFTGVTSINVPASVVSIGERALQSGSLTTLTVDDANPNFTDDSNVLYSQDMTTLWAAASAKSGSYVVPDSVTVVKQDAFRNSNLSSIMLGSSLTTLEDFAMAQAQNLTQVLFRGPVPALGSVVFNEAGQFVAYHASANSHWAGVPTPWEGHVLEAVSAPTISNQPAGSGIVVGMPLNLSVATSDPWSPTFQWSRNGQPIPGATASSYTLPSAGLGAAGTYSVAVTNWAGTTISDSAIVTVAEAPPAPTPPAPPAPKTAQSLSLKLPAKLIKNRKYSIPRTTAQGVGVRWDLLGKKYCAIRAMTLRCTKSTKGKSFTIRATAGGTDRLLALSQTFARKVK